MVTPELLELTTKGTLQAQLEKVAQARRYQQVKVGLLCAGRMATAAVLDSAAAERAADASLWMRTGCLTKLFMSALVLKAIGRGHLRFDEDAGGRLSAPQLAGISVSHLLEHAHGLDDSGLKCAPVRADGGIDVSQVARQLTSRPPLSAPGMLYSYSHAGALLLAAILQQVYGRSWYALVQDELCMEQRPGQQQICPSWGYDLTVRVDAMLTFSEKHARESLQEDVPITHLPGWHSSETGVRCSWKCYAAGWMGHNSEPPAVAAAVRVHPGARIAIAVEAGEDPPAPILAALFGRLLPDLVRIRFPALLKGCGGFDPSCYVGEYEDGSVRVAITRSTDTVLELRAYRRHDDAAEELPFIVTPLRPAQDGVFYLLPHSAHFAPFVQFTGKTSGGTFRFLWNGRSVWRNVANLATS